MTWISQRAARLRKPVVADWLTTAVPEWLAPARPQHSPVPWAEMIRATLAICLPISAGLAVGQPQMGTLIALGGTFGIAVDNGGPIAARLRRVGSAAVLGGAAGLAVGSLLHGRGWIAVAALVALAGISALLSSISGTGSVIGLQLIVYASVSLGPLGTLRPWWHTALGFVLGAAWALVLTVPGWLLSPRAAERRSVAAVYRALAGHLRAIGTTGVVEARQNLTAALNAAYDTLLTRRSTAGGRNWRLTRLMALLNQGNLIGEATTTCSMECTRPPPLIISTVDAFADTIEGKAPAPDIPELPGTSAGMLALRDDLAGVACLLSGSCAPTDGLFPPRSPLRQRLGAVADRLTARVTWTFTLRLMACVGVAGVLSEVLPLQRSYWVVLTVVIVLKPDFGSVFTRAVQRGIGTVIGAVLGAAILAVVPYGPWLLLPFGVFAALLPYGKSRNFGLMSAFLTPLVVLFIDLLAAGGWRLAADRLLDTLLGCAIVLLVGYAPWPSSWQAHLPGQFAAAVSDVCRYLRQALLAAWADQTGAATASPAGWSRQDRQAYRALSDLRTEFDRTMSEPRAISRRATAWWPAVVGLEAVADAITATAVAISRGALAPRPAAVSQLATALDAVAGAVQVGEAPRTVELPADPALWQVTEAVRAVLGILAGPK
jgi:uncharacterized membrane protein YccC